MKKIIALALSVFFLFSAASAETLPFGISTDMDAGQVAEKLADLFGEADDKLTGYIPYKKNIDNTYYYGFEISSITMKDALSDQDKDGWNYEIWMSKRDGRIFQATEKLYKTLKEKYGDPKKVSPECWTLNDDGIKTPYLLLDDQEEFYALIEKAMESPAQTELEYKVFWDHVSATIKINASSSSYSCSCYVYLTFYKHSLDERELK